MKNKRGLVACILFLIVFAIVTIYRETKQTKEAVYQQNEGIIFNTIYHITYQYDSDLQAEIEDELHLFDATLSPFNKTSVITRVNANDTPTANASILVATDKPSKVFVFAGLKQQGVSSSLERPSRIIFIPSMSSTPKATQ